MATRSTSSPPLPLPAAPGLPEEIAAAITYLVSDATSFVHGAVLPVDGCRIAV
jgi:NAD(P)-dependent dehydrogenase (short-subunit alcohol dehydrogenase family)